MNAAVEIVCDIFIALAGLCIGSFLNVLIYRLPLGMSLISPPSHCPQCNAKIKWYDNIPLVSYLVLRGKCRHCGQKIPFRYFFVELSNLILWVAVLAVFDLSVYSVAYALITSALIAIVFIDAEHQIIPDSLNIAIAAIGIVITVYSAFFPQITGVLGSATVLWWEYLAGGFGAALLFAAVYLLYRLIRKKEGMGLGDVKMIGALGLALGYKAALLLIGLSAIFACIYILIMKIAGKLQADKPFAFGPFIAGAAYACMLAGNYVIGLYLSLF